MLKKTKVRYSILAAVFITVVINYMDRTNIAVAATAMTQELVISNIQLGYIFSAFGWTYATMQIPGGIMADRYGIKYLYSIILLLWSMATIGLGFATGFAVIIALRALIGAFEAPSYPMNNRIVTRWFPENERAGAIATYTSGQFIGLAFLTPVLTAIQLYAGWRGLFFITGSIGIGWAAFWFYFYKNPIEHNKINEAELQHIEEGGGLVNRNLLAGEDKEKFEWSNLALVLSERKLWGIYIGQFGLGCTLIFFLTWFPRYLVEAKQMDFLKSGFIASVPFLCAFAGVLFSGFLSDYLVKKNIPAAVARKTPIVIGLLLSISIIGANYVTSSGWVIFFMSIAFFGNGLASITWIFVSLLAPKHLLGLTGGTFNFIGGLSGIVAPIVIGYLVKDNDFSAAIIFIGCMALAGALSYIFLVGKIERITTKEPL